MTRDLFLAITIPDDLAISDDPDDVADEVVRRLNYQRQLEATARSILKGGAKPPLVERITVNAIPSPQWLTPETLAALRRAAQRTNPRGQS